MKSLANLLFIFTLMSCSMITGKKVNFPPVKVHDVTIKQGHAKKIILPKFENFRERVYCEDKVIGHDETDEGLRVFLSGDYHYKDDQYSCQLQLSSDGGSKTFPFLKVTIEAYPFEKERLRVNKKHVKLSDENIERWKKEKRELEDVYDSLSLHRAYFHKPFVKPLKSKITSNYGKERIFNNKKSSWHSGVDFRAWYDTPIPVTNRGKVVFTGHLFFNGKTVIVDHGLGIATLYCHLKKIKAQKGEIVSQGDIIGLAGNTGRTTAPHLHWGARVQGNWINGLSLVYQTQ